MLQWGAVKPQFRKWVPILCAGMIVAASAALEWRWRPAVFSEGRVFFVDPDDHMRLCRVREILDGRRALVQWMPEINWPVGGALHWTAPMDYLIVAAVRAFGPLVGDENGVDVIAAWLPVWIGAAYFVIFIVLLRRACCWPLTLLVAAALALLPPIHRPFALGHPDHHCLLELLFMLAVMLWLPRRRGASHGDERPGLPSRLAAGLSGLFMGLALWVAPQAMAVWLAILAGTTLATFRGDISARHAWADLRLAWNGHVMLVVVAARSIENQGDLAALHADKIGLLHVMLAVLAIMVPSGTGGRWNRFIAGGGPVSWAVFAVAAAGFAAAVFVDRAEALHYMSDPVFFRWSEQIIELQPLWTRAGADVSLLPMHERLGWLPYALPLAAVFFMRSERFSFGVRVMLVLLAVGFTALSIVQRRWLDHVAMSLVLVSVVGAWEASRMILDRRGALTSMRNVLFAGAFILLLALPTRGFILEFTTPRPFPIELRSALIGDRIRQYEQRRPAPPGAPRAIMANDAIGPMLLYRTGLPIVAAPYHRTLNGIVESARFYAERDASAALEQLRRLGVRYVVVPYRAHEYLMNYEYVAFGEPRSFDPPIDTLDEHGMKRQELRYRPEIDETMAYRLVMQSDNPPAGLECIAVIREGAATPNGYSGLLYVVTD